MPSDAYRRTKFALGFAFFAVYAGGLITGFVKPLENKLFPIVPWFMFDHVPQKERLYCIYVLQSGAFTYTPPIRLEDLLNQTANPQDIVIAKDIVKKFGKAYRQRDYEEVRRLRVMLEKNHLKSPAVYTLNLLEYDPLILYQTGEKDLRTLATYTAGR